MTCEFFSDGLAEREAQLLEEANAKQIDFLPETNPFS